MRVYGQPGGPGLRKHKRLVMPCVGDLGEDAITAYAACIARNDRHAEQERRGRVEAGALAGVGARRVDDGVTASAAGRVRAEELAVHGLRETFREDGTRECNLVVGAAHGLPGLQPNGSTNCPVTASGGTAGDSQTG